VQKSVRVGLISAGSPKRLVGEQGEDYPAYVHLHGKPIISYVVQQALLSDLELIYIWTNPERVSQLEEIVSGLEGKEKIKKIVPSRGNIFDSMTYTIKEYVTSDLFNRSDFQSWAELLSYSDTHEDILETPVLHISSDAPFIQSREINDFIADFDPQLTDYSIGITLREAVEPVLDKRDLLDEFKGLASTIKNFTHIYDDKNKKHIAIRLNNLHILKAYKLDNQIYDFLQEIFDQRGVSRISRWLKLARLIRKVFNLPWLNDEAKKKNLYKTVWELVRSQENVPGILRKDNSKYVTVANLEENISFLMSIRSSLYLGGEIGAFFDADAQEEFDFLSAHFDDLYPMDATEAV